MACECMTLIDREFKAYNTRLQVQISINSAGEMICVPYIGTEKIDKKIRKREMGAIASFCPFCGTRYREPKPEDTPT